MSTAESKLIEQIKRVHKERTQLEQMGEIDSPIYQDLFDFEENLLDRLTANVQTDLQQFASGYVLGRV